MPGPSRYTDFVEEFGVLRDLKMLTVHRIFYALSDMPECARPDLELNFQTYLLVFKYSI